jgi:protease-4
MGEGTGGHGGGGSSMFRRVLSRTSAVVKTSFAAVGFLTTVGLYMEYGGTNESFATPKKEDKKRVVVVPFHRLKLVEHKKGDWGSLTAALDPSQQNEDKVITMDIRELVDLIHHAAQDESVTCLYGIFGHGSQLASQGWADVEEVRNALRVFRESHRRHMNPNLAHEVQVIPRQSSKPLYAYTDSFVSLGDPANKEYYLASIFTHIHMQKKGELNLLGMLSEQVFLRGFLEKYGIGMHVFKHGQYKNAPNMFTNYSMDQSHRFNVTNLLETLDQDVCDDIAESRSKNLLASWLRSNQKNSSREQSLGMWKSIHEAGTFQALQAWKAGLVDYLPSRDPLPDLVDSRISEERFDYTKADWDVDETDFDHFKATQSISLEKYAKEVRKKKQQKERMARAHKNPVLGRLLSLTGMSDHDSTEDKVALVHLEGTIGDEAARKTVNVIRKIKKDHDVKAVVLRVSSRGGMITPCETIAQELRALKIPVVVSFGNVSASGGYYVAAAADRIFCSKKTVTGSIGVFGIRLDLTQLAANYGVNVQHVSSGDLAAVYQPLAPMSRKMKRQVADSIDRHYAGFKDVVATGRDLPVDYVELIAQGRVWTGDQAKTNGLVDELGGLTRAIAYAKRIYTSGDAEVVVWPKRVSFFEKMKQAKEEGDARMLWSAIYEFVGVEGGYASSSPRTEAETSKIVGGLVDWIMTSSSSPGLPDAMTGVMLAADEDAAIRCLLDNAAKGEAPIFPADFWG